MGWQDSINEIQPTNPDPPEQAPLPADSDVFLGQAHYAAQERASWEMTRKIHEELKRTGGGGGGVTPGLADHAAGTSRGRELRDDGSPHH